MSPSVRSFVNVGIPDQHSQAFLAAAETSRCVILTRTPGVASTMLLSEGYDGKCFHIKGKSCNWGPMAGFVCLDPLLNKSGMKKALYNLRQHFKSVTVPYEDRMAQAIPLMITDRRKNWLVDKRYIERGPGGGDWWFGTAEFRDENEPQHAGEFTLRLPWGLRRAGRRLWAVYYDRSVLYGFPDRGFQDDENALAIGFSRLYNRARLVVNRRVRPGEALEEWTRQDVDKFVHLHRIISSERRHGRHGGRHQRNGPTYDPVMALVNPHPPYHGRDAAYLNATTGDYDLFGVWPPLGANRMKDVRPVRMRPNIDGREIVRGEDRAVGNISDRVFLVAQLINSEIAQRTRETVIPNRVFHSDEAGRPFVSECNLPVAAFLPPGPRNRMIRIDSRDELRRFVRHHEGQYRLYINPACVDELVLSRNMFSWD